VRIFEIAIICLTVIITYSKLRDIVHGTTFSLAWLVVLMILIGSIYVLLVLKDFLKEKFDINRIVVLLYLIIFCFSLFAGIAIFKSSQPLPIIPKLPSGTVGLRSYGCNVTFTKIEISFLDSNNIWQVLPREVTNDKNSWKKAFKTYGDTLSDPKYTNPNDTTISITLNNSGVKINVANLKVAKYFKSAQYFKIDSYVTVNSSYEEWADFHFCMNVPIKNDDKESEELYLGFSIPVVGFYSAKIYIPALVWEVGSEYKYSISKLNENGIDNDLTFGTQYHFVGVSFYNSARFLMKNSHGASILCESKFESNNDVR